MPDTPLATVLECIYGLMLVPDVADPLDSHNALAYYNDSGGYEGEVIQHVQVRADLSSTNLVYYGPWTMILSGSPCWSKWCSMFICIFAYIIYV